MTNPTFQPSAYQQAIFDFIQRRDGGSLMIDAKAGSGKSTTIIHASTLLPEGDSAIFMAFNKAIAKEVDGKLPSHIEGSTFHSQGFRAWMKYKKAGYRAFTVDGRKVWQVLDEITNGNRALVSTYGPTVKQLVGLAKNAGFGVFVDNMDFGAWLALIDHHGIYAGDDVDMGEAIKLAQCVLMVGAREEWHFKIDFDDMLYLPLLFEAPMAKFDWVFVDEYQDTNMVQVELISRMLKPGGRLIGVGDRSQAIYGFRGASVTAVDASIKRFNMTELPLSVCYRCSEAVIREAQKIVPEIECAFGAAAGEVVNWHDGQDRGSWMEKLDVGDVVLCRNNAPLLSTAYSLLAQGIGCYVAGRDIGEGLVKLIDKMRAKGISGLVDKLAVFQKRETEKLRKREADAAIGALEDKMDCLHIIINSLDENNRTIPKLISKIESMFSDKADGRIELSSVHKSKGQEWNNVYLLDRAGLMPSKFARQDWQMVQEKNLEYVAITRARQGLFLV